MKDYQDIDRFKKRVRALVGCGHSLGRVQPANILTFSNARAPTNARDTFFVKKYLNKTENPF
jgi:hypothetical protein